MLALIIFGLAFLGVTLAGIFLIVDSKISDPRRNGAYYKELAKVWQEHRKKHQPYSLN